MACFEFHHFLSFGFYPDIQSVLTSTAFDEPVLERLDLPAPALNSSTLLGNPRKNRIRVVGVQVFGVVIFEV